MGITTLKVTLTVLAVVVLAVVVGLWSGIVDPDANGAIGYAAGADKKVYAVDLLGGKVLRESGTIDRLGRPTSVAFADPASLLFIASERDTGDFFPLVSVRVNQEFLVDRKYALASEGIIDVSANRPSVYTVEASPDGRRVYLGFVLPSGGLTTVLDPVSGTIIGRTNVPVRSGDYVSQDGRFVAEIWPSGSRIVDEDGQAVVQEWPGGVVVREIATGNVVSRVDLADNRGLNPPWSEVPGPYLIIKPGTTTLSVYDRVTGSLEANIELRSLTGMTPAQTVPIVIPGTSDAALSMVDSEGRGFVVVIDVRSRQVKFSIPIGPSPTNVVLGGGRN